MPYIFSYGSNSIYQLRGRIKNIDLVSFPAYLDNYKRIFCNYSEKWNGGIASIIPKKYCCTYGIVTYISLEELSILDSFEVNYSKKELICTILEKDCSSSLFDVTCIVYISDILEYICPPSEQYLMAIKIMLEEHFPLQKYIIIAGYINNVLVNIKKFFFPVRILDLQLPSLFVITNSYRKNPHIFPKILNKIINKLNSIQIIEVHHLVYYLQNMKTFKQLNNKLIEKNMISFSEETFYNLKSIII